MSRRAALLMLAPVLVASVVLVMVPALATLGLAFTRYDGLVRPEFSGLANFRRMWSDPIFRTAMWNSIVFVAMAVPLRLAGAFGAAMLHAGRGRVRSGSRAASYLPTMMPDVAYAFVWLFIFNPAYGPLSAVLGAVTGGGFSDLLFTPWGARVAIVAMTMFQLGEGYLVMIAMRRDISPELYELGRSEGASPFQLLRSITLPMMAPALMLLAARDVALSFQANLVPALLVTKGGPRYSTTYLPLYTYQNAFEFLRFGYASAMTLSMYLVTLMMIFVQFRILRRWRVTY